MLLALTALALVAIGCSDDRAMERLGAPREQPAPSEQPAAPVQQQSPAPTRDDLARAAAPAVALAPPETDWSGGNASAGRELYGLYCLTCHGSEGKGDGPAAAALNPKPRDFTSGSFAFDANANNQTGEDIDLARVIREGPVAFGGSAAMPVWKQTFSQDQIRDLVAYVRQLSAHASGG
jgi:mono/diheme cytochrome c family protein